MKKDTRKGVAYRFQPETVDRIHRAWGAHQDRHGRCTLESFVEGVILRGLSERERKRRRGAA